MNHNQELLVSSYGFLLFYADFVRIHKGVTLRSYIDSREYMFCFKHMVLFFVFLRFSGVLEVLERSERLRGQNASNVQPKHTWWCRVVTQNWPLDSYRAGFGKIPIENPLERNFLEISRKFLEISRTFPEICRNFIDFSRQFLGTSQKFLGIS